MAIEIRQTPVRATATRRRIARGGTDTSLQGVQTLARITELIFNRFHEEARTAAFYSLNDTIGQFVSEHQRQLKESEDESDVLRIIDTGPDDFDQMITKASIEASQKVPFGTRGGFLKDI